MPIDARIPLGVEPVPMPDFAQLAVQRASVMNSMAEIAAKNRALNEQNTLAQLVRTPGYDPTNPEWRRRTATSAPNLGAAFLKAQDDAATAQTAAQAAARAEKDAQRNAALQELFLHDNFESAEASIDAKVAEGALTAEQATAVKARMRSSRDYATFAFNHARSMLTPDQMTEVTRETQDVGGKIIATATPTRAPVGTAPVIEATYDKTLSPDEAADNARAARADRDNALKPFMATGADGTVTFFDASDPTKIIAQHAGTGKPSGGFEKAEAARGEAYSQIAAALPVVDELLKPGSNVDKAEGGGLTVAQTALARLFGITTEQMKAQAQLGPQGYVLLQQVPRFEGPQSDKDTAAYKDAAGKLTNEFSTAGEKRAALGVIREILLRNKTYLDKNPQAGAAKTASPSGGQVIDWADLQ